MRAPQYLYVREAFPVRCAGVPAGVTINARICADHEGSPAAIGSLDHDLTEITAEEHGVDFPRESLLEDIMAAKKLRQWVYLHLDNGVDWHDVWPLMAVDTDPDLLPPLVWTC